MFDRVLAFEVVDTQHLQVYFRGEVEFVLIGTTDWRVHDVLKRLASFEQKFIPNRQSGTRVIPRKLWRIRKDGSREAVNLPAPIVKECKEWEESTRRSWNSIPVDSYPPPH